MKKRNTIQKQIILKYLMNTKTHPTAAELYNMIKQDYENIGQATVYRNLKQLEEQNMIIIVSSKNNIKRYDGNINYHNHFICEKCGKVIDVMDETKIDTDVIEKNNNVKILNTKITYEGICNKCYKHIK